MLAEKQLSPNISANEGVVVVAIVGYRNADDIASCMGGLTRSHAKNFTISICENGGSEAYEALIQRLSGLVDPADEIRVLDQRVAEMWSGRLSSGGQRVWVYRAKDNLGYAGGINVCIRQIDPTMPWSALWVLNPDTEPAPGA